MINALVYSQVMRKKKDNKSEKQNTSIVSSHNKKKTKNNIKLTEVGNRAIISSVVITEDI